MDDDALGLCTIVDTRGRASTQVGSEPTDGAFMDTAEKGGVVDGIESLGKIHCHRHRPLRGAVLVEASGYLVNQWQERSGGGASRPEAMLGIGEVKMGGDQVGHEALKDFGGWA